MTQGLYGKGTLWGDGISVTPLGLVSWLPPSRKRRACLPTRGQQCHPPKRRSVSRSTQSSARKKRQKLKCSWTSLSGGLPALRARPVLEALVLPGLARPVLEALVLPEPVARPPTNASMPLQVQHAWTTQSTIIRPLAIWHPTSCGTATLFCVRCH